MTICTGLVYSICALGLFVISLIAPLVHILVLDRARHYIHNIQETMLKYSLFLNIGCLLSISSIMYIYSAYSAINTVFIVSKTSSYIALGNLGLGVLGLICPLFTAEFWLATIIALSISSISNFVIYLRDYSESCLLYILIANILIALWLIVLYSIFFKNTKKTWNL